ncbi:hypothetical protein [Paenibacillus camelliae]|uniref:hypothetical protein n=1 Tax=Paenibacillus camelliae TaxID=512410 RepID=UPI00204236E9|nr:hypothetical protein [Paenibacillus camelliae]MCM3632890.1 hypothetical protein [Paenibacillus camelliae]
MIKVTERFGLEVDTHNYMLMEYRTTDPTKLPTWNNGKDKNGNDKDPTPTTKWASLNKYYPASTTGLASALQEIAHREVREGLAGDVELKDYVAQLHAMHNTLKKALETALTPNKGKHTH